MILEILPPKVGMCLLMLTGIHYLISLEEYPLRVINYEKPGIFIGTLIMAGMVISMQPIPVGLQLFRGGFRIVGETFEYMTDFGFWWSSVESSIDAANYIYMTITSVSKENYKKAIGGSIRLIKDSRLQKLTTIIITTI